MKSTIYINEAKFTADNETLDTVIDALTSAGFIYDEATEGYIERDFYANAFVSDENIYGLASIQQSIAEDTHR